MVNGHRLRRRSLRPGGALSAPIGCALGAAVLVAPAGAPPAAAMSGGVPVDAGAAPWMASSFFRRASDAAVQTVL